MKLLTLHTDKKGIKSLKKNNNLQYWSEGLYPLHPSSKAEENT